MSVKTERGVQSDNSGCVDSGATGADDGSFVDAAGRSIDIDAYDGDDYESLVSMYVSFDSSKRAQGIPPLGESAVRSWLDDLARGYGVVARHEERAVGHAVLVARSDGGHELAIFVHQSYQRAGIGGRLLDALLAHGGARGVETVWLTVERWNRVARSLYRSAGFEVDRTRGFEIEMTRTIPR